MTITQGRFCWYELMTGDTAAAQAFYSAVVGWTAQQSHASDTEYFVFSAGSAMVAGLMTLPEEAVKQGARPSWIGYIAVDDVDASVSKLQALSGLVHRPAADIPGIGRFAVVADPQGAAFCLFKPAPHAPPPPVAPNAPGHAGWRELMAGDMAAAFDFYAEMFGWTIFHEHDMGAYGVYRLFGLDGARAGGMMTKMAQMPVPFWTYYFQVEGIEAAAERVKAAGGTIVNGPMEVPGGEWIVQGFDPQGAFFALVSQTK